MSCKGTILVPKDHSQVTQFLGIMVPHPLDGPSRPMELIIRTKRYDWPVVINTNHQQDTSLRPGMIFKVTVFGRNYHPKEGTLDGSNACWEVITGWNPTTFCSFFYEIEPKYFRGELIVETILTVETSVEGEQKDWWELWSNALIDPMKIINSEALPPLDLNNDNTQLRAFCQLQATIDGRWFVHKARVIDCFVMPKTKLPAVGKMSDFPQIKRFMIENFEIAGYRQLRSSATSRETIVQEEMETPQETIVQEGMEKPQETRELSAVEDDDNYDSDLSDFEIINMDDL
ncbi:hypothetical protein CAEBREN_25969 [Caenorhabditis brenneri]|uniref:Uncharacterized protein n=1 Tax=Caenorhabditis brenneri TaxID=135651 RepID=G0NE03_CAEBE|nr:hypothetical protein CAEBREN_25969 [Caenorhabditis brenneri]